MLDLGLKGLVCNDRSFDNLDAELTEPTERRMFAIAEAIRTGYTVERIHEMTHVDRWFLSKMKNIVELWQLLKDYSLEAMSCELFREAKRMGFSDGQIAFITSVSEGDVRKRRKKLGITPCIKQIDTLAGEYPASANYLYLTYNGIADDLELNDKNQVVVIGGGAYRIGSSVEFDWCCVNTVLALKKLWGTRRSC